MNVYLKLMEKQLHFAIIGCGKIAPRHAAEAAKHGQLVAVCDIIKEKANLLAQQFSAKAYYTITDLLSHEKEIDIVSVCTPNGLHAEHSIQSLQAGSHVLCEKPLTLKIAEYLALSKAVAESKKVLFTVHNWQFAPIFQKAFSLIQKGRIGPVWHVEIFTLRNNVCADRKSVV